jgi:NAD(P)-dependent dehydrogenase (short-subunit alcohol dehydrogenase family)
MDDNPDLKKQWTSLIPQGNMGNPEDLMGAVTFLSSDASAYVTGAYVPSFLHPIGRARTFALLQIPILAKTDAHHISSDLRVDGGYTVT